MPLSTDSSTVVVAPKSNNKLSSTQPIRSVHSYVNGYLSRRSTDVKAIPVHMPPCCCTLLLNSIHSMHTHSIDTHCQHLACVNTLYELVGASHGRWGIRSGSLCEINSSKIVFTGVCCTLSTHSQNNTHLVINLFLSIFQPHHLTV